MNDFTHEPRDFAPDCWLVEVAACLASEFRDCPEKIVYWLFEYNETFKGPPCVKMIFDRKTTSKTVRNLFDAGILDPYVRPGRETEKNPPR